MRSRWWSRRMADGIENFGYLKLKHKPPTLHLARCPIRRIHCSTNTIQNPSVDWWVSSRQPLQTGRLCLSQPCAKESLRPLRLCVTAFMINLRFVLGGVGERESRACHVCPWSNFRSYSAIQRDWARQGKCAYNQFQDRHMGLGCV